MNLIGLLALAMTLAPAIAIVLVLAIRRPRPAEMINLIASVISLASISAILLTAPRSSVMFWNGYVVIDGLGVWTILCAALVYFLASIYAVGYMRLIDAPRRLHRFYALFAGFAPIDNPRYAICVIVEHGGSGAHEAAPIARDILVEALGKG